jgi:hypothetical protein
MQIRSAWHGKPARFGQFSNEELVFDIFLRACVRTSHQFWVVHVQPLAKN